MPDPIGTVLGIASIGATFTQWLVESGKDRKRQTIDEYLEWLRRRDHAETMAAVEQNRQVLVDLIESVKTAVLTTIADYEMLETTRHEQLMLLLTRFTEVSVPRLEFSFRRELHRDSHLSGQTGCGFSFDALFVNRSASTRATIQRIESQFIYDGSAIRAHAQDRLPVAIDTHGASTTIKIGASLPWSDLPLGDSHFLANARIGELVVTVDQSSEPLKFNPDR